MGPWIIAGVTLVLLVGWRAFRSMWRDSRMQVEGLPSLKLRRTWALPAKEGDRIMWCPILSRKVVLAETGHDEGEIGTVVGFAKEKRQNFPIVAFDERPDEDDVIDRWGAARVLPVELTTAAPRKASVYPLKAKKKRKKKR
jgi:hypothetical protein